MRERGVSWLAVLEAVYPEDEPPMCFERLAFTSANLTALLLSFKGGKQLGIAGGV